MPPGDSPRNCLAIYASPDKEDLDSFETVKKGLHPCWGSLPGHGNWPTTFPEFGLNFRTWIQRKESANQDE